MWLDVNCVALFNFWLHQSPSCARVPSVQANGFNNNTKECYKQANFEVVKTTVYIPRLEEYEIDLFSEFDMVLHTHKHVFISHHCQQNDILIKYYNKLNNLIAKMNPTD